MIMYYTPVANKWFIIKLEIFGDILTRQSRHVVILYPFYVI